MSISWYIVYRIFYALSPAHRENLPIPSERARREKEDATGKSAQNGRCRWLHASAAQRSDEDRRARSRRHPISEWGCRCAAPVCRLARHEVCYYKMGYAARERRESGSTTGENGEPWAARARAEPGSENDIAVVRDCAACAPAHSRRASGESTTWSAATPTASTRDITCPHWKRLARCRAAPLVLAVRPVSVSTCTFAKRRGAAAAARGRCTHGRGGFSFGPRAVLSCRIRGEKI